jgi:hypothetical protein
MCTFCRGPLVLEEATEASVIAVTEVQAPPLCHEDVPYWCALVQAEDGSKAIVKLDHAIGVGAEVSFAEIESPYGRDAFLLECERQGALVGGFLDRARAECRDREMSIR